MSMNWSKEVWATDGQVTKLLRSMVDILQKHNCSDLQNVFQDITTICTLVVFNVSCVAHKGEFNWS